MDDEALRFLLRVNFMAALGMMIVAIAGVVAIIRLAARVDRIINLFFPVEDQDS